MAEPRFNCALIGGQSLLIQCAELLLNKEQRIACIVTTDNRVRQWADGRGIRSVAELDALPGMLASDPLDYLFSIVNLSLLPERILALPRKMAINFHDAPLPQYAGLNTTSWALLDRQRTHAVNWHQMTAGIDQGKIVKTRRFAIADGETAFTLNTKCLEAGIDCFAELLEDMVSGALQTLPQDQGKAGYYARRKRPTAAGCLAWSRPAQELAAMVRALDYGPGYPNPLVRAKILLPDRTILVGAAEVVADSTGLPASPPGTIESLSAEGLLVATGDGQILLRELKSVGGRLLSLDQLTRDYALQPGLRLRSLAPSRSGEMDQVVSAICTAEPYWQKELAAFAPLQVPYVAKRSGAAISGARELRTSHQDFLPRENQGRFLSAAVLLYLARIGNQESCGIPFQNKQLAELLHSSHEVVAPWVPLAFSIAWKQPFHHLLDSLDGKFAELDLHRGFLRDLIARSPGLDQCAALVDEPLPLVVARPGARGGQESVARLPEATLGIVVGETGELTWRYDPAGIDDDAVRRMAEQLDSLLQALQARPFCPVAELSILTRADQELLRAFHQPTTDYPRLCAHQWVERQVELAPQAPALACREERLDYRELNERANRVAHLLRRNGARSGQRVGVLLERSADLVVALLGVWKSGAAYVPLDPEYPPDRLAFMARDAGLCCLVTGGATADRLPDLDVNRLCMDDAPALDGQPVTNPDSGVRIDDPAYLIYTSGSTGKPKGVMVEHGNLANFFAGMEPVIGAQRPGVWLAVTSVSFDISVLELFWTLAHGFQVVLYIDPRRVDSQRSRRVESLTTRHPDRPMQFSLFYWNVAADGDAESDYELLMESARFGDQHGFSAVWTPERHFGSFGGLYPNPAVTSAAVAAVTRNIHVRAGSCVVPLHDPIRIAEEWAVVDRLSGGRVGLAAAAGWMPNDFVLKPEHHAKAKEVMLESLDTVRRLWRGESIQRHGPQGTTQVSIRPRPVQPELPVWITTAGSQETYLRAATMGANLLTHLLGQSLTQVEKNIALYRETWARCGHPGRGQVTLLLHTLVGDDEELVREAARQPMKRYLASAVSLVKDAAWEFPTYARLSAETGRTLDEFFENIAGDDLDALLEFAYARYYDSSGLFGSPRRCLELVDRLKEIDVDEIGCLIDFGIDTRTVLDHLPHLNRVRQAANRTPSQADETPVDSIGALIRQHGVTHLQCTPSQATLLVADAEDRAALANLKTLLVGGEALPMDLARQLKTLVGGDLINVYGPTETTIWSATHRVGDELSRVPLGGPIANTALYVLDERLQPLPPGVPGELVIGGAGVTRGYHERPELTEERFVVDPFAGREGAPQGAFSGSARRYRTGDLACITTAGRLDFLGRLDFQVKLRGYRIELGEIEQALRQQPGVREAVALLREDRPGDQQLVAYVLPEQDSAGLKDADIEETRLRDALAARLPEFMRPSSYVLIASLPMTPNGKLDRKALPPPKAGPALTGNEDFSPPATSLETQVAEVWQQVLGRSRIGTRDNFFDLGGHSLLVIRMLQLLRERLAQPIQLTDLFRFPTIQSLAAYLQRDGESADLLGSRDRGAARRAALGRRRRVRSLD